MFFNFDELVCTEILISIPHAINIWSNSSKLDNGSGNYVYEKFAFYIIRLKVS